MKGKYVVLEYYGIDAGSALDGLQREVAKVAEVFNSIQFLGGIAMQAIPQEPKNIYLAMQAVILND